MLKKIIKAIIILVVISIVFSVPYYYLLIHKTVVTTDNINTYQFRDLTILYFSSCVTTLALIVALLKDEIRSLWLKAKIEIKPKSPSFIIEKQANIGSTSDIKAEYYYVVLIVKNTGSLHINLCSIALTNLIYKNLNGNFIDIDISSSDEIKWIGKSGINTPIHSNGGKAEASVIEFKINDAGTPNESRSQPAKLFISGVDATKNHTAIHGSLWVATFMIYYDTSSPVEYNLEISWDGEWHNRLPEMLAHSTFKVV